jgi:hypothetical protein
LEFRTTEILVQELFIETSRKPLAYNPRMNHQSHTETGLTEDTSHGKFITLNDRTFNRFSLECHSDIRNIGRQKSKKQLSELSDFGHFQESDVTMTLKALDITKEKVPSLRFDNHRHDNKIRKAHTRKERQVTSDNDCSKAMKQRNSSLHKATNRALNISNLTIEDLESLDNSYNYHEFLNLESEFLVPV